MIIRQAERKFPVSPTFPRNIVQESPPEMFSPDTRRSTVWIATALSTLLTLPLTAEGDQSGPQRGDQNGGQNGGQNGDQNGDQNGGQNGFVTREEHDKVVNELKLNFSRAINPNGATENGDDQLPGHKGGLYDKPFLDGPRDSVTLGGYFDIEYRDVEGSPHEFRFHRLIPFIYADIHERVRFATEIEIEDGADLAVEFATLDVLFTDEVNFRGGVILNPLGKFNLIHDSPINDLTDRPLVNRSVIPTTFREVGAGLFGDITPEDSDCEIKYEAYITSGYKGLDNTGATTINTGSGVRGARAHGTGLGTSRFDDINNKFSGVGRLSISPVIGSEFGVSAHSGAYDEAGDNNMTTGAIDGLITIPQFEVVDIPVGPIEIQGEGAYAWIERNTFARMSGVPGDLWGYYVQANYHFMPQCLIDWCPILFFPEGTFTFVVRWDQVNLDGSRMKRTTFGLNYRPVESTVFKLDFQYNNGTGNADPSADDDAIVFSIASFF